MALAGLDIGGTGVKAVVFGRNGEIYAYAYREYNMIQEHPGWYEFRPEDIYEAAMGVLSQCVRSCDREILGIGVSSFGESWVLADEHGNVLSNGIIYLDDRGQEYVDELSSMTDLEEYRQKTGTPPRLVHSIYKLRVMEQYHPGILKRARSFHFIADFVLSRLGGGNFTDYGLAATSGAFDINSQQWISWIWEWAGLNPEILPSLLPAGSCTGKLSVQAAKLLGLKEGIPLVLGGHDHTPTSLSAGVYRSCTAMNAIGTTDSWTMITNSRNSLKKLCPPTYYKNHLMAGHYIVMPKANMSGGVLLKWFRDNLGRYEKKICEDTGRSFYEEYEKRMPSNPTNLLVLPRFGGFGKSLGDSAGILNMTLSTTSEEIYRAFMEGETFEMYGSLKSYMENIEPISEVAAVNGGANCDTYMQIRADVYALPVYTVACSQPGALGNAMLAGVAAGVYADVPEAVRLCRRIRKVFEPDRANHEYYMEQYEKYLKIYDFLGEIEKDVQIREEEKGK